MVKAYIYKPCGVEIAKEDSRALRVYDSRGRLFYMFPISSSAYTFNLPRGVFYINVPCKLVPLLTFYKKIHFEKTHNFSSVKRIVERFDVNPNKCSIFFKKGIVVWDWDFYTSLTRCERAFILMHERGHYFYKGKGLKSEIACDIYAAKKLLKKGFNPSQIAMAQHNSLSATETTKKRMKELLNKLSNI